MNKIINGSQVEMKRMSVDMVEAIAILWTANYSSHAFILEQILTKLEKSGYAPREEIEENWRHLLAETMEVK